MTITITSRAVLVFAALIVFARMASNWLSVGTDDSDVDGWRRSGMAVYTDHKTGLQYLASPYGGLTPRLDAGDHQMRDVH